MIKMIKSKFLPIITAGAVLFTTLTITACGTTQTPQAEGPSAPATTKTEPKIEDTPDVVFVKELQALLEKNDIKGAIAHFDNLPKKLQKDMSLKNLLGALYYSDAQYDNAIATAQEILAIEPENMPALELISMCNKAKGDKKAYKEISDKILETDPYNAAVNIQKAEEYAMDHKFKLARDAYKKALRGDSENVDAIFGYALMSYYTKDFKEATDYFQKLLDKDPENPNALAYMGKLAYDKENYLRATKYVQEALKHDPTNYGYWMDYGTYLRFQGKFNDAIAAWTKATELDPTYFLAYAYLAGIYDEQDNFAKALENYHKVIETNPNYFYAYESTAILEYHANNYAEAIKLFAKTYEYSASWSYSLMIAACYYKLNKPQEAKKVLTAQLKKLDSKTTEYALVRFFNDSYSRNAESALVQKINKETNRNNRGKMLFYMGLYYELNKAESLAKEYYGKVANLEAPMFFEYRIAEWGFKK